MLLSWYSFNLIWLRLPKLVIIGNHDTRQRKYGLNFKGKTFWHLHKVNPVLSIGYSIPGHSIWKRMHWGEAEMHSFSYTNDQVLEQNILQACSLVFLLTNLLVLLKIIFFISLKTTKLNSKIPISGSKAFPSITTYVVYEQYSITQDKESMG
jgi:hypothetical protein